MKNIKESYNLFKNSEIGEGLNNVYEVVTSGHCIECTRCCSESVNTFYSEFLAVLKALASLKSFHKYIENILTYYFTELVRPQKCPLLKETGHCAVYSVRPLPCRIFGHLAQTDYESNYEALLEANEEAASYLKENHGIIIPKEVSAHKVPFCTSFKTEKEISLDERDELVDELFILDSKFLMEGLLSPDYFNLSLVQWFAYEILGVEKAQELRLTISKEISDTGNSSTLEGFFKGDIVTTWCENMKGKLSEFTL